ncbi:MAG TPA: hypothetical protein PLJ62_08015 [Thermoflexales bacterium]|nr:hypothetical protein [Thermoflexales bacterium]HQW34673.1 hypothetical protein [Thermoflexales bacterium]HQX75881.1 hypothetical protein [Thermoflexales bacterium]HQZ22014.1 hypothetical protein [Thermoflexales bacterium]HRA00129.1 hypothetical protein [Thermoflexales bacterium]
MSDSSQPKQPAHVGAIIVRDALIGGATVALAIIARQQTTSPELQLVGLSIILTGLTMTGYFAARDVSASKRAGARTGGVAGVLAGFIGALALSAALLMAGMNGTTQKLVEETLPQMYSQEQMQLLTDNNISIEAFTQYVTFFQIMCCGAAMPVIGLALGALGGYTAPEAAKE